MARAKWPAYNCVPLALDWDFGIWFSVNRVSLTPGWSGIQFVAQEMLSLLRLLASFPNDKIVGLSCHTYFTCVCVCLDTCMQMVVCSWGWVSSLMALHAVVPISCWTWGSLILAIWDALGYQSLPQVLGSQMLPSLCDFLHGWQRPKITGPHAGTANTLSLEPSPLPWGWGHNTDIIYPTLFC